MKKVFLEFTGNTCAPGLQIYLKKRPWHMCFQVNFAKFLRTPFLIERKPLVAASLFWENLFSWKSFITDVWHGPNYAFDFQAWCTKDKYHYKVIKKWCLEILCIYWLLIKKVNYVYNFVSATKISGKTTNILNCYFSK